MKVVKVFLWLLLIIVMSSIVVLINTIHYSNNITSNEKIIRSSKVENINVDHSIKTSLVRGSKFSVSDQINKNYKPQVYVAGRTVIVRSNGNILENMLRTIRYGGDDEKIVIEIPKNQPLDDVKIDTERGVNIDGVDIHNLRVSNKFGDVDITNNKLNSLTSRNKYGDVTLHNDNVNDLDSSNRFGDTRIFNSNIEHKTINNSFGDKIIK